MKLFKYNLIPGIILLIIMPGIFLSSQDKSKDFPEKDTTAIVNPSSTFTNVQNDSIQFYEPLKYHGSLDADIKFSKNDINLDQYNSTFELISQKTNSFPLYLGAPGLFNQTSFFGMKLPVISYSYNGRVLNDFETSSYNLEEISSEFFEQVELLKGTYSVIENDNSIGVSLNFQERINNTAKPYTKLWYAQNSNDLISLDGIYSQNFIPNTNFSFGFRRQFAFGFYDNSKVDNWNVRAKFRWNPSDLTSISLTENFNHLRNGLYEGLNLARTSNINYFDQDAAIVNFYNFSLENFSHDITLSLTHLFNKVNSSKIQANIFYSYNDKSYNFDETQYFLLIDSSLKQNYFIDYYGFDIRYTTDIMNFLSVKSGIEYYKVNSDSSNIKFSPEINTSSLSLYSLFEFFPINNFKLYGGARYKRYLSQKKMNYGFGVNFKDEKFGSLNLDYSQSYYFNPLLIFNDIDESHQLILLDYNYVANTNNYSLGAYYRKTKVKTLTVHTNSIFYIPENETFAGGYINIQAEVWKNVHLKSKVLYNSNLLTNTKDYIPKLFVSLSSYYRFYAGPSIMNLGFKINLISKINYFPYSRQFLFKIPDNENIDYYNNFMFNGISIFAIAKLGNAYVKASFDNILGTNYYYVPIYPNFHYNIRFSFSWSFYN